MKVRKLGVMIGVMLLCSICVGDSLTGKDAPSLTIREWITRNPPKIMSMKGSVYVLEFWAMWCTPCVEDIPRMISFYKKYKPQGLNLIALSQDKSAEEVRRFVSRKGITYSVAIDNGTADWFGVRGYPTVVVVNHEGKVVWRGYPWQSEFEKAVIKALKAAPAPLLSGIDLGPFRHLEGALCGGSEFSHAYEDIKLYASGQRDHKNTAIARTILDTIDKRISQEIKRANQLETTDLLSAYYIYEDIIARYDGIEAVEPAKTAYYELKKNKGIKARLLASAKYHNVD
jgi:thiol-disulfide isomerase/thioredoxin